MYALRVNTASLLRLIEVVRRELGAADARIELGGEPPTSESVVWRPVSNGFRAVVVFDEPIEDPRGLGAKLETLLESFSGIASMSEEQLGLPALSARRSLDDELAHLAEKSAAIRALVIDDRSPMVWGNSESPRGEEDIETLLLTAGAFERAREHDLDLGELLVLEADAMAERVRIAISSEDEAARLIRHLGSIRDAGSRPDLQRWRAQVASARAVASVRSDEAGSRRLLVHEEGLGFISRSFAAIYRLMLVFDGEFSELHAEAAIVRALPIVERLVLAVPPVDPPPEGGRLLKWPGPRSNR